MSAQPIHIFASDGSEVIVKVQSPDTVAVYVGAHLADPDAVAHVQPDECVRLARWLLRAGLPEPEAQRALECIGNLPSSQAADQLLVSESYDPEAEAQAARDFAMGQYQ